MTTTTGMWDVVDLNAATFEKIRRLRSALRTQANLEVLAVVAMASHPTAADRVPVRPPSTSAQTEAVDRPEVVRRVDRGSDKVSFLDLFPSEKGENIVGDGN